jgi:hypothetical protein
MFLDMDGTTIESGSSRNTRIGPHRCGVQTPLPKNSFYVHNIRFHPPLTPWRHKFRQVLRRTSTGMSGSSLAGVRSSFSVSKVASDVPSAAALFSHIHTAALSVLQRTRALAAAAYIRRSRPDWEVYNVYADSKGDYLEFESERY